MHGASGAKPEDPGPFPVGHAVLVAANMLANAASFTVVFPFIGWMVVDLTGCQPGEAGYYAGYVAGGMMVGRTCSAVPWGWVADRYGRRPVLIWGNLGIAASGILFGLSSRLWHAVAARVLMGVLGGGLTGTGKVVVSELFAEAHQAAAMGVFGAIWGVGVAFGPAVGGLLARPSGILGRWFHAHPYLPPCIVLALISAGSALSAWAFLPETLRRKAEPGAGPARPRRRPARYAQLEMRPAGEDGDRAGGLEGRPGEAAAGKAAPRPPPGTKWYLSRAYLLVQALYAAISFTLFALDETQALYLLGSLNWSTKEIGGVAAATGLPLVAFQVGCFPAITRRLGSKGVVLATALGTAPISVAVAATAELQDRPGALWPTLVALSVAKTCVGTAGFTAMFILVNNSVAPEHRGTANGWGTVVSAVAKALGPIALSPVYAWSVGRAEAQAGDHYLAFLVVAVLSLAAAGGVAALPESLNRPLRAPEAAAEELQAMADPEAQEGQAEAGPPGRAQSSGGGSPALSLDREPGGAGPGAETERHPG